MKPGTFPHLRSAARRNRRGIALIIVLACLVLMVVMVLAFLGSIGTELRSSKFYANGSSVKLLAQSATDLVMAEIRDATMGADSSGNPLAWASQPGMIRTYDTTGINSGSHTHYYKLYSDATMTGTGAFDATASGNAVPAYWYNAKGVYVDLNLPVSINGTKQYPIIDGLASDLTTMTGGNIAGFSLTLPSNTKDITSGNGAPMPVRWLYVLKQGQVIAPTAPTGSNTVTTTVSFPTTDASGNAMPTPTAANPIVGRMAFWTDDETCKVNINTASEPSAIWDVPRMQTPYDAAQLASYQPVQNEFQRYPGHPATVALSTVFGGWLPTSSWTYSPTGTNTSANYQSQLKPYYQIAPRVVTGIQESVSSGLGTTTTGTSSQGGTTDLSGTAGVITPDTDRLYDSVEELMFAPNATTTGSVTTRTTNSAKYSLPALTQAQLEQAKFFITAHSRAPDVNLFNQPRVSMWPVSSNTSSTYRSANDQVIAFCTQLGKDTSNNPYAYYFQRFDPTDPTADLPTGATPTGVGRNRSVIEYLRFFMKQQIPGFGGSFGDAATGKYNGLDALTSDGITTTNGATTLECDQILTEIFDYIRSTNTVDQSQNILNGSGATVSSITSYTSGATGVPKGQVVPIVDTNGTRGFGRFPTLQQVGLIFYASNDNNPTLTGSLSITGTWYYSTPPVANTPQTSQVKCLLAFQFFDPSLGFPTTVPWYKVTVSGQSAFTWDGTVANPVFSILNDPATLSMTSSNGPNIDPPVGGVVGVRRVMWNNGLAGTGNFFSLPYPSLNPSNLPLTPTGTDTSASNPPGPGLGLTSIHFTGGPLTVSFWKLNATGSMTTLLQKIVVTIPDAPAGGFPMPGPSLMNINSTVNSPPPDTYWHAPVLYNPSTSAFYRNTNPWENWANRWRSLTAYAQSPPASVAQNVSPFLSDRDTVRAVVPSVGDLRLLAARTTIPTATAAANYLGPHALYSSTTARMAHSFRTSLGHPVNGYTTTAAGGYGKLVPLTGPTYAGLQTSTPGLWTTNTEYLTQFTVLELAPDMPTTTGVFTGGSGTVPGDWDNGVADYPDGAYINKADEGDNASGGTPYFYQYGSQAVGQTFFSPNREVPSAGMLGSLSTGVLENKPWQTLLFRPGPVNHPGLGTPVNTPVGPPYTTPPDSLILDLFTMPVVEPYAISEPLSTAGRINMNYQIIPFTYITRSTGMRAVMKGLNMISIPNTHVDTYKYGNLPYYGSNPNVTSGTNSNPTYRVGVDPDKTLLQFTARFTNNDIFRSPSEICSVDLVPSDYTGSTASPGAPAWRTALDAYWNARKVTGDNSRERVYANIYPLLTTKSNTYTIHYRVQTLQKVQTPGVDQTTWLENTDLVTAEYRGSQTIERYVDPNDSRIPDYAATPSLNPTTPLSSLYKFRVVSTKQFAP